MDGLEWQNLNAQERLLAEFAVTQYRTLQKACDAAPDGKVLGVAERLAVDQGREATRLTLTTALQQQAAEVEKKGVPAEPATPARQPARTVAAKREDS